MRQEVIVKGFKNSLIYPTTDGKKKIKLVGYDMHVSDGYHTMEELYEHRHALYIALCNSVKDREDVWKSEKHSNGSDFKDWFIMGINSNHGEQITYHLPISKWEECGFAHTLDKAPEYDGHKPKDVLQRLSRLI